MKMPKWKEVVRGLTLPVALVLGIYAGIEFNYGEDLRDVNMLVNAWHLFCDVIIGITLIRFMGWLPDVQQDKIEELQRELAESEHRAQRTGEGYLKYVKESKC